jgi:hypothetical protein
MAVCALLLAAAPAYAGDDHPVLGLERLNHIGDQVTSLSKDVVSFLGFGAHQANNPTDPQPVAEPEHPKPELTARAIEPAAAPVAEAALPGLPVAWDPPTPRTETPLHRLFCVEYARMRSGLSVFGDARHWWDRAKNLYARLPHPVEEAVMVFSGSKRLKRGHVAVVTDIVSPRQIIVDQANWQNKGEIDHATPVLDVSPANDWSLVRVWDMRSNGFGAHVYAISGFIAKGVTTASRD